jgi:hypothetical protein
MASVRCFLFIPWVPSGPAWIERGDVKHCQGDASGPCICGQRTRFARHWVDREGRRSPQDPHEGAGSGASNRDSRDEHLADPFLSNPLPSNYIILFAQRVRTAARDELCANRPPGHPGASRFPASGGAGVHQRAGYCLPAGYISRSGFLARLLRAPPRCDQDHP